MTGSIVGYDEQRNTSTMRRSELAGVLSGVLWRMIGCAGLPRSPVQHCPPVREHATPPSDGGL